MKLASTRLIARDIKAVVGFYEKLTNLKADWLAPVPTTSAPVAAFGLPGSMPCARRRCSRKTASVLVA